ncbi:MAG: hypothetical protein ACRCX2_07125 [Paraclostridium sp.]
MFIENIDEYKFINQSEIEGLNEFLWSAFHKLKPMVNKCEYEDLQQDIILAVIEADKSFDPKYEVKFFTYLRNKIMFMSECMLGKYKGVNLRNSRKRLLEKQTGEKIYINITNLEEEV